MREPLATSPLRLLVASGRDALTGDRSFDAVPLSGAEWSRIPSLAHRHGLTAWVHAALAHRPDAPAEVTALIAVDARAQAADALRATRELVAIVTRLQQSGIACVTIKGPTLGLWLYGSAGARRFTDLDVVVDADRTTAALDALEDLGYRLPKKDARVARVLYGGRSAWPLSRPQSFPIDLHWRLADLALRTPVSARALIEDASTLTVAGTALHVPSTTHTAALTFAHAAKHGWCGLELLLALAHVMRRPDVDWTAVHRLSVQSGTRRALSVGARLAEAVFGVPPPEPIVTRASRSVPDALAAMAHDLLARPAGVHADRWEERQLHRASLDRGRDRLRYEAFRLLMPTPMDGAWCRLPPRMAALYVPLRLVRLTFQTIGSGLRFVGRHS